MVVGHVKAARHDAPHVLFYGHYDVQPADPLNLWRKPPFEPTLESGPRGEQIVARGACDDKGQLMTFLEACRAFRKFGGPPCAITALIEGEEETGSPSLPRLPRPTRRDAEGRHRSRLRHGDVGTVDAGDHHGAAGHRHRRGHPRGANRDLHSGIYGGAAVNPIHVLCRILGELHDAKGAVACPDSTTESRSFRRKSGNSGANFISTRARFWRRRLDNAGRRTRPQAARATLVAPDLRDQRNCRGLYRRGNEDGAAGAGERQGLVPAGRRAEPRPDPGVPRFRRGAPAAGRKSGIHFPRGSPAIALPARTKRWAGRNARSERNGASLRR